MTTTVYDLRESTRRTTRYVRSSSSYQAFGKKRSSPAAPQPIAPRARANAPSRKLVIGTVKIVVRPSNAQKLVRVVNAGTEHMTHAPEVAATLRDDPALLKYIEHVAKSRGVSMATAYREYCDTLRQIDYLGITEDFLKSAARASVPSQRHL